MNHWVLLLNLLALKEFKHVVVGHRVARFSLMESVDLVLGRWRGFLNYLRLLLHHYTLARMASILLLISVHATSGL